MISLYSDVTDVWLHVLHNTVRAFDVSATTQLCFRIQSQNGFVVLYGSNLTENSFLLASNSVYIAINLAVQLLNFV